MYKSRLTDDDRKRITEKVNELAKFEEGDHVTVEPSDHDVPYGGRELEGVLLTVDEAVWRDLDTYHPRMEDKDHIDMDRVIELDATHFVQTDPDDGYESDRWYIRDIEYTFKHLDGHGAKDYTGRPMPMGERSLIPWCEFIDEYYPDESPIHLKPHRDGRYEYIFPHKDDHECPICGSTMRKASGHDNSVVHVGAEVCAACGHCFQHWD